jgi:hypothetical protein
MAEFSGRVVSAQFIDAEYTIIKVLYDDNGMLNVYNLDVNPDHPDYQDLLAEGWDQEKIIEETAEAKRAQAAAFNIEVQSAAKILAQEMVGMQVIQEEKAKLLGEVEKSKKELLDLDQTAKIRSKTVNSELYEYIFAENFNKEELFKAKLWALELEVVKSADKDIKSSIRKATRITQVLGIIDNLVK